MIRGMQIRESTPVRVLASLLIALIINALLLLLIHSLVSATKGTIADIEALRMVDFIRLKPQPKTKETPAEKPETEKVEKQESPPEPLEAFIQRPERQKPPRLRPEQLALDPRASLSGDPYLGDFEPALSLSDLDAGEPSLQIPPVYPPRAKRMGIEGEVTVEFTITADGSVEDAKIVEADPSRVFDRAVLRAIRRWKFAPRIVNGRAIERRARKQIVFKLERR